MQNGFEKSHAYQKEEYPYREYHHPRKKHSRPKCIFTDALEKPQTGNLVKQVSAASSGSQKDQNCKTSIFFRHVSDEFHSYTAI